MFKKEWSARPELLPWALFQTYCFLVVPVEEEVVYFIIALPFSFWSNFKFGYFTSQFEGWQTNLQKSYAPSFFLFWASLKTDKRHNSKIPGFFNVSMNVVFKYHLRVEPALQGTLARNYFVPGHQILLMNSVDLGKRRFFGQVQDLLSVHFLNDPWPFICWGTRSGWSILELMVKWRHRNYCLGDQIVAVVNSHHTSRKHCSKFGLALVCLATITCEYKVKLNWLIFRAFW